MPRSILDQLSPNHVRNHEYSPYTRAVIFGMYRANTPPASIANDENIPYSTVRSIIKNTTINHATTSAYRPEPPMKLNDYHLRRLIRYVRQSPKAMYTNILRDLDLPRGQKTAYRTLKDYDITNWLAKKRSLLTDQHA